MKRTLLRTIAVLAVMAMLATGCSRKANTSSSSATTTKVVKIGVIAPLTGDLSPLGLGIKNAVDLAIKQANSAKKVPGWNIIFAPQDDAATAATGANAASKLASDDTVAGVVGTLNSSVALQVAPILQQANIVEISPANTGVQLTKGTGSSPQRQFTNYFRVCTNDAVQGPFAADYAFKQAGFKKVATVNDKKAYGQGLVAAFEGQFKKDGGTVVSHDVINPGDKDFGALTTKIAGEKPDLVYYGGEFPEAAPLSAQLKDRGATGPLMGGDGLYDPGFIKGASGKGNGDLATSVGAPTESLQSAKEFVSAYNSGGYGSQSFSAYGAFAYDAANIIINALAKALPNAKSVREARPEIIKAVGATQGFQGAVGTTSFDQYGDTSNKVLTVYKVTGSEWKPVFTGSFAG